MCVCVCGLNAKVHTVFYCVYNISPTDRSTNLAFVLLEYR
jgi:hypothetical protein